MEALRITSKITNRQSETFKKYLSEIGEIKMFTDEEEVECSLKVRDGDKDALEELIRRNLRFVVSVAKQYEHNNVELEDLVNEGNIGLIIAAEKYKADKGFKFISFAVYWIRKMILEYLTKNARLVRLPANKIVNLNKYNKTIAALEQVFEGPVEDSAIIDALKDRMDEGEINELRAMSTMNVDSLDSTIGNGESESNMYDVTADSNMKPTDHLVNDADMKYEVETILKSLKDRDRKIMVSLFGLDGNQPLTLKQVADEVGLTREMVRQIKCKALRTLKNAYTS